LRFAGLSRERRFANYHRVLNRAVWDARAAACLLLGLLIAAFAPSGPVLLGIDDTIERRRGKRISAQGIYRDPVRSSKGISSLAALGAARLRRRIDFVDGQRPALAQSDASGPDSVGRAVGSAAPDGRCRSSPRWQLRSAPAASMAGGTRS
jgi:hypothetical protein